MLKILDLLLIILCVIAMISVWFSENIINLRVGGFIWILISLILIIMRAREE